MPRFTPRPRNLPRFAQGRMWNKLSGNYAPRMFSNPAARRPAHQAYGTQAGPWGAGGGSMRQIHGTPSGHAGNVYNHMLAQARRGGTNLGLLPHTPGYTGSRTHRGFRQDQAAIKRHFRDKQRQVRADLRSEKISKTDYRRRMQNLQSKHRLQRRAHATGQGTQFLNNQGFSFRGGGGKGRQWSQKMGQMYNPRARIDVRQDPYTGRRHMAGYGFRQRRYSDKDMFKRRKDRASRMHKWRKARDFSGHEADFTRGGRRSGRIQVGDHWNTGINEKSRLVGVQGQTYRTQMDRLQLLRRQGAHAPAARAFMQPINTSRALRRQHPILRGGHGDYHQYVRNNQALWNPFK